MRASYYPWRKGVYEVAPALRPFGTDFGNGEADQVLFQLDEEFPRYRANKLAAVAERKSKYVQTHDLPQDVETAAIKIIQSNLSDQTMADNLDDLALQIPEDIAIVVKDQDRDWTAYLNLCSPSHWAAEDKIGRSFFETHVPIPAFEKVNAVANNLVDTMINKGPFVRFVWGVESDDRLNHHPQPPLGQDPELWKGRNFSAGRFWVRTERQVMWGMPEVSAALFVIRVGYVPDTEVLANEELRESLISALKSMSPAARAYKGLDRDWGNLLPLLEKSDSA